MALKDLDLADLAYTPHSPRAGWATTLRLGGMPFTEIQERGRWQNAATLRIYLDAVAASKVLLYKMPLTWMIISPNGFHSGGSQQVLRGLALRRHSFEPFGRVLFT